MIRVLAVITSKHVFAEWAQRQPTLYETNPDRAIGDGWIAHRLDSPDMPWQGGVSEVIIIPTHGEAFSSPMEAIAVRGTEKAA